ncbi:MAG: pseudouridine synthase [Acidobacteriota bacterium]
MPSRAPRPSRVSLPCLDAPPATVLEWLVERFPRVDRQIWVRRMERGLVTDDADTALGVDAPFVPHLRIAYFREVDEEPPPRGEIHLLHRDAHLVVADKPPFMPVTPAGGVVRGCLLYRLEDQLGIEGLAPAHRLDRTTSGLVMLTRRREERGTYTGLFADRRIERTYVAIARVPERPATREWSIASRIVKGEPFFRMREIDGEANAWTQVHLEHWQNGWGRFRLRPETGKTHQLRLHMARLGWPIHGDRYYPELQPEQPDDPSQPLALVAKRLEFRDPITGEDRLFDSRLEPQAPCGPSILRPDDARETVS